MILPPSARDLITSRASMEASTLVEAIAVVIVSKIPNRMSKSYYTQIICSIQIDIKPEDSKATTPLEFMAAISREAKADMIKAVENW
jgi:hypothetical protein